MTLIAMDELLIRYYNETFGNSNKASYYLSLNHGLDLAPEVIRYRWKKISLRKKTDNRSTLLRDDEIQFILKRHRFYGGNPRLAAKSMPYYYQTIRKIWIAYGLEIKTGQFKKRELEERI